MVKGPFITHLGLRDRDSSGFSLIELAVAGVIMGILGLTLTSLMTMMSKMGSKMESQGELEQARNYLRVNMACEPQYFCREGTNVPVLSHRGQMLITADESTRFGRGHHIRARCLRNENISIEVSERSPQGREWHSLFKSAHPCENPFSSANDRGSAGGGTPLFPY